MKDCKLYVCTALFICITAVKLCFPGSTGEIRNRVKNILEQKAEYTEVVETLGRSMFCNEELVRVIAELVEQDRLVSAGNMYND